VRPFSIPLLVGLAITILVAGFGWRRALSGLGWATLAFAVVVAPWIVRNAMVMHAPTFSTNMGDTVCIDRYEHSTGRFRFTDSPRCAPALTPEAERNTENIRFALRFVRHHPEQEFGLIGMRFRFMMERDDDGLVFERLDPFLGQRVRSVLGWVANGYYFTTLPLAIGGLIVLIRRRRPDSVFVLTAIGTLFAIPMVLWGSPRFHFPLVPFIAITAAQPIAWALSRWSSMITAPSPSPGNPDDSGAPGAGNG
jgi:hypothetical protein